MITYALPFEINEETTYRNCYWENKILRIENIESFYNNNSNPDNDYKLLTSVLSDKVSFELSNETTKAKSSKRKENDHKKEFIWEKSGNKFWIT